jgi:hypothetical protein
MVGNPWACKKQIGFMGEHVSGFQEAQEDESLLQGFWPSITGQFFTIWPDQDAENVAWDAEAEAALIEDATTMGSNGDSASGADKSKKRQRKKKKAPCMPPVFASHAEWVQTRTKVRPCCVSHPLPSALAVNPHS